MPWRREWQPTPVFLPGESYGQRSLVGYSRCGHKESFKTEQLTLSLHFSWYILYMLRHVLYIMCLFYVMCVHIVCAHACCVLSYWVQPVATPWTVAEYCMCIHATFSSSIHPLKNRFPFLACCASHGMNTGCRQFFHTLFPFPVGIYIYIYTQSWHVSSIPVFEETPHCFHSRRTNLHSRSSAREFPVRYIHTVTCYLFSLW